MGETSRDNIDLAEKVLAMQGTLDRQAAEIARLNRLTPGPWQTAQSLITNGTFATDVVGWVEFDAARGTFAYDAGAARLTNDGTGTVFIYQEQTLLPGTRYLLSADATDVGTATARLQAATTSVGSDYGLDVLSGGSGPLSVAFTTVQAVGFAQMIAAGAAGGAGDYATFDNVALWEADPSDDAPWLRVAEGWKFDPDVCTLLRDNAVVDPSLFTLHEDGQFIKPLTAPGAETVFRFNAIRKAA